MKKNTLFAKSKSVISVDILYARTSMMKKSSEGKARMPTATMGFGLLAIVPLPPEATLVNFYDI